MSHSQYFHVLRGTCNVLRTFGVQSVHTYALAGFTHKNTIVRIAYITSITLSLYIMLPSPIPAAGGMWFRFYGFEYRNLWPPIALNIPLLGHYLVIYVFHQPPAFIFATHIIHHCCNFKYFHLILLSTFSPLLIILAIIWLNFDFKLWPVLKCVQCIMVMIHPPAFHPKNFLMKNMNSTNSGLIRPSLVY